MITFKDYQKVLRVIGFNPENNLRVVNGDSLEGKHTLFHSPEEYAIYGFTKESYHRIPVNELLKRIYPKDFQMIMVIFDGSMVHKEYVSVENIKIFTFESPYLFIYFKPFLENSSLSSFIELIAHLRAPDGCPWDRKQNHLSLRTNLLEETYEVLEAIDNQDMEGIKEELGDLLLQIILHAQIATENLKFNIHDVMATIHSKITYRHPHVFQNINVNDVDGVKKNWEMLKSQERETNTRKKGEGTLSTVPKDLPALSTAQSYQERAARVGFDWPDIEPVIDKIEEEILELKEANDERSKERELGDLLFAIVNLIRWYGFDAESVLRQMNRRFLNRFSFIEKTISSQGRKITDLSLEEMDVIWEMAKQVEV